MSTDYKMNAREVLNLFVEAKVLKDNKVPMEFKSLSNYIFKNKVSNYVIITDSKVYPVFTTDTKGSKNEYKLVNTKTGKISSIVKEKEDIKIKPEEVLIKYNTLNGEGKFIVFYCGEKYIQDHVEAIKNSNYVKEAFSPAVLNAISKPVDPSKIKSTCPHCGFNLPSYPGRYPVKCPGCGNQIGSEKVESENKKMTAKEVLDLFNEKKYPYVIFLDEHGSSVYQNTKSIDKVSYLEIKSWLYGTKRSVLIDDQKYSIKDLDTKLINVYKKYDLKNLLPRKYNEKIYTVMSKSDVEAKRRTLIRDYNQGKISKDEFDKKNKELKNL